MRIKMARLFVDDQDKALKFYTEILGFRKKTDVPAGDFRWLTVVSPEAPDGVELLLEPNAHRVASTYQQAIRDDGIPATTFFINDTYQEVDRLQ